MEFQQIRNIFRAKDWLYKRRKMSLYEICVLAEVANWCMKGKKPVSTDLWDKDLGAKTRVHNALSKMRGRGYIEDYGVARMSKQGHPSVTYRITKKGSDLLSDFVLRINHVEQ